MLIETEFSKEDVMERIKELINPDFFKSSKIKLQENLGNYDSIIIQLEPNAYRSSTTSALFARLKLVGKQKYISFSSNYADVFKKAEIPFFSIKSDPDFIRIAVGTLFDTNNEQTLSTVFNNIFLTSFSFQKFDCCAKFEQCSNDKKCLHDDIIYSSSCVYRKHLENGRIFYGENKNI